MKLCNRTNSLTSDHFIYFVTSKISPRAKDTDVPSVLL